MNEKLDLTVTKTQPRKIVIVGFAGITWRKDNLVYILEQLVEGQSLSRGNMSYNDLQEDEANALEKHRITRWIGQIYEGSDWHYKCRSTYVANRLKPLIKKLKRMR